jgi:Zn ribbon nucleic-acid-binding protein
MQDGNAVCYLCGGQWKLKYEDSPYVLVIECQTCGFLTCAFQDAAVMTARKW